jgi:hypothetical protein
LKWIVFWSSRDVKYIFILKAKLLGLFRKTKTFSPFNRKSIAFCKTKEVIHVLKSKVIISGLVKNGRKLKIIFEILIQTYRKKNSTVFQKMKYILTAASNKSWSSMSFFDAIVNALL